MKMRLDMFKEPAPQEQPGKEPGEQLAPAAQLAPEEQPDENSFTPGQQSLIDKLISQTIQRERGAADKREIEIKKEAERVAQMDAAEKAVHERAKQEEALQAREMELRKREARALVLEKLGDKGYPKGLADLVDYQDPEASLDTLLDAFNQVVEEKVNAQMRQDPPATSVHVLGEVNPWNKETWNFTKQNELSRTSPAEAIRLKALAK